MGSQISSYVILSIRNETQAVSQILGGDQYERTACASHNFWIGPRVGNIILEGL
jgi:hypothetical protein